MENILIKDNRIICGKNKSQKFNKILNYKETKLIIS